MLLKVIGGTIKAFVIVNVLTFIGITLDVIYNPINPGEFSHEDIGLDIDQVLTKYGYPFENHSVTTEDGYVLQLHRIPHGRWQHKSNKKVLILMHGLHGNSISFLTSGPNKSLPYYLADNGYDVWLPNARGNCYSRKHISLDPDVDKKKFYDFSWNEIGIYDLPAAIDYIIKITGKKQLYYSGFSQGSVTFFVMLSERPEYNEKVKLMVGLAPVVYVKHTKIAAFYLPAMFPNVAKGIMDYFPELLPKHEIVKQISSKYCRNGSMFQRLCIIGVGMNGGFNIPKLNTTVLPLMLSNSLAGSASKQLLHYSQIVNSDIFRKYDHDSNNLEIYGQESPPEYKFENMRVPFALFYGNNDWYTLPQDYAKLVKNLPNVVLSHRVEDEFFTHIDFVFSDEAVDNLFPYILDVLNKY